MKQKDKGVVKRKVLDADCPADIAVGRVVRGLDGLQKRRILSRGRAAVACRHDGLIRSNCRGPRIPAVNVAPYVGMSAALRGFKVLQQETCVASRIADELRREKSRARVGGPVPVVKGKQWIHFPQQSLEPIAQLAMPGHKGGPGMNVLPGGMGVLVYFFLLIPVSDPVRIDLGRI